MIRINCELCGKVNEKPNRTLIEGVELDVCIDCSKFGKVIATPKKNILKEPIRKIKIENKEKRIELLVDNYSDIIKKQRESMGISQKDFASMINEKESVIHKIETGTFEPQLLLAKKLERVLKIKLIEEYEDKHESPKVKKGEGFTLGDFIKFKK